MNVTFDSSKEHAWPGDEITFPFLVENSIDRHLRCTYRLEGPGAMTVGWRVVAPNTLGPGDRGRGELRVRAPKNPGPDPLVLSLQLTVSTADPDVHAEATCTPVVRPARFAVRPMLTPKRDGTLAATLSIFRHGRAKVDAEVELGRARGWRLAAGRPSITVHSSSGRKRLLRPRARWSAPDITLNPDGTVKIAGSFAESFATTPSTAARPPPVPVAVAGASPLAAGPAHRRAVPRSRRPPGIG